MTAHVHDPAGGGSSAADTSRRTGRSETSTPRWLLPAVVGAIVAGALLVAGVVSLSTLLYAGLFGGMILMHVGGHGHGHGGHGGGGSDDHAGLGDPPNGTTGANLSRHSPDTQDVASGSNEVPDERAADTNASETDRNDQHSSTGCH